MPASQLFLRERVLHNNEAVFVGRVGLIGAERLQKIAELSIRSGARSSARVSLLRQIPKEDHLLPRLYVVDAVAEQFLEEQCSLEEAAVYSPYGISPPRDATFEPAMIGSVGMYKYLFENAFENGVMYTSPVNTLASIDRFGRVAVQDVSYYGTSVYANWTGAIHQNEAA